MTSKEEKNIKTSETIDDTVKPKRKTHTSSAVKNKYNQAHYTRITIHVKKEEAERYKKKCKDNNIPYSQPLQEAVQKYLEDN